MTTETQSIRTAPHPMQVKIDEYEQIVKDRTRDLDEAIAENTRVKAAFEESGQPKTHSHGYLPGRHLDRKLSRARANQSNARKALTDAEKRLKFARVSWAYRSERFRRFSAESRKVQNEHGLTLPVETSWDRWQDLLREMYRSAERAGAYLEGVPQNVSDLSYYAEDLGGDVDPALAQVRERASEAEAAIGALIGALDGVKLAGVEND